jgi:hypothetical protein
MSGELDDDALAAAATTTAMVVAVPVSAEEEQIRCAVDSLHGTLDRLTASAQ